ncbi:hypothetical protein BZG36_00688 [Bifiguratus adelaidae]|uniref:Presenilin n=1 Tax=Bifiguratus adelaidae TaxID=1938954 RepID=A0A261Y741_9FUNG|nr:hypothetical protein BZG36_00688 [Bifiguratus adelaidae]
MSVKQKIGESHMGALVKLRELGKREHDHHLPLHGGDELSADSEPPKSSTNAVNSGRSSQAYSDISSPRRNQFSTNASDIALQNLDANNVAHLTETSAIPARTGMDEETAEELKYYMHQVYLVIQPVMMCIVLSIFWVKIAYSSSNSDYRQVVKVSTSYITTGSSSGSFSSGSSSSSLLSSFGTAAIIISQIIVVTIIIVCLFKYGCIKILTGFFMIVVLFLLAFMGYLLMLNLVEVFSIPLDYLTMCFALWNFAVMGLVAVFWKAPLWLQQAYMTVMSSLMAFSLTGLEEWTTWILLGLLAIWDLVAVLCPFGPLRILVESSRSQQREIPALLYSVNAVWIMATPSKWMHETLNNQPATISPPANSNTQESSNVSRQIPVPPEPVYSNQRQSNGVTSTDAFNRQINTTQIANRQSDPLSSISPHNASQTRDSFLYFDFGDFGFLDSNSRTAQLSSNGTSTRPTTRLNANNNHSDERPVSASGTGYAENRHTSSNGFVRLDSSTDFQEGPHDRESDAAVHERAEGDEDDEEEERSGLKLGLGDFVFYSVLIARASVYDWVTTVCCTVAVLTGLNATIYLLAIYKKALPALPISIAFGILFFFVAKQTLVPFVALVGALGGVGL